MLDGGDNVSKPIYLDSYTLQADSRIRLPKSAIENLNAIPGKTRFNIYFSPDNRSLVLEIVDSHQEEEKENG